MVLRISVSSVPGTISVFFASFPIAYLPIDKVWGKVRVFNGPVKLRWRNWFYLPVAVATVFLRFFAADFAKGKNMANLKFDKEVTALLVIDPHSDFISEWGRVWGVLKTVKDARDFSSMGMPALSSAHKPI
jgi:hypothetical protein